MALADVYDALITERPYKKAFSHDKSIAIIKEGLGRHFDPYLAKLFIESSDIFEQIGVEFADSAEPVFSID